MCNRNENSNRKCLTWIPSFHPVCCVLWFTIGFSIFTTSLLAGSMLTERWEIITFHRETVNGLARSYNLSSSLRWVLDGKVGILRLRNTSFFFVPMNGGVWTLCSDLDEEEKKVLWKEGWMNADRCVNYLHPDHRLKDEHRTDRVKRLQNLSISCALVCLILLGASGVVGGFGILRQGNPAILITGIMYLLTGGFAVSTLGMMSVKRLGKFDCGYLDEQVPAAFYDSRLFALGWSYHLAWFGVALCLSTALLWFLLARIARLTTFSIIT
ncbi:unnamed protein product [Darwinula stevensoni]|uniref:Uncharacterized protein n=1 Tax=Darwinula stevensoni TaxID=69355 RepID=A0A7R8X586_9CRUS|nr:unnamed protein product [Darwinula stevensoni]CAG0884416.1 unnamed protein product [Darwinula stevensoni]